jgi:hypothetical protein
MSENIRNEPLGDFRSRTLEAARQADKRVRRRHRVAAVVSAATVVALLTAGGLALTAPPPPPPLPPEQEIEMHESWIEARWAELQALYPDATRPDAKFERFITKDEEGEVVAACLREQGIPAEVDEYGWNVNIPIGQEQEYDLAIFVCEVRFPLSPSLSQPFTEEELRYIYRYFVEQLRPCLQGRGYEIGEPPSFEQFRETWWTDDTPPWSPYRDLIEHDADAFEATQEACPPTPPDLRP